MIETVTEKEREREDGKIDETEKEKGTGRDEKVRRYSSCIKSDKKGRGSSESAREKETMIV